MKKIIDYILDHSDQVLFGLIVTLLLAIAAAITIHPLFWLVVVSVLTKILLLAVLVWLTLKIK